jgi:hypothetical protein
MFRVLVILLRTDGQSPCYPATDGRSESLLRCYGRMVRVLVTLLWTDVQSPCCLVTDGWSESLLRCYGRMVRVLVTLLRTDVQSPCYLVTDGCSESSLRCYGRMVRVPFTTGGRLFRAPDIRKDLLGKSSTILVQALKQILPLSNMSNCKLAPNSWANLFIAYLNATLTGKDTTHNMVFQI